MSDETQPELRWAPIPPKPSRAKRNWLIAGLIAGAVLIAAAVLFFILTGQRPPVVETTPEPSPTPTASAPPTRTPTPTPTGTTPAPSAAPPAPVDTAPPVADPSLHAFRDSVSPWLGDAGRGLDIVMGSQGQEALSALDILQEDAQRLSDAQPPSSILEQWHGSVDAYVQNLTDLRDAVTADRDAATAAAAARADLTALSDLVGL